MKTNMLTKLSMSHFDKNAEDASQVHIEQKRKKCLVLDKELYRYQQFISDIAGQDIQAHNNEVETIVRVVRNWLRNASGRQTIPGGNIIWERYQTFSRDLPQTVEECQLDIEDLIFNDYILVVEEWLKTSDG